MSDCSSFVSAVTLAAASVVSLSVFAAETSVSGSRMDRSKLQIGTYYLHPVAQTEAHVKAMKECGIDFVFGVGADRRETLDLLAKYGIGCVATEVFPGWGGGDGRHAGQLEKLHPLAEYTKAAQAFCDHPAIWMVDIGDEPSALEFPYYARVIPEIRRYLPKGVEPYLNLYPNYAQVTKNTDAQQLSQLGTATYGEHVDRYAKEVPLDYLSYDFYVYSAKPAKFDVFLEKMYDNFETVAAACRRTNRSFWYIPQVNNVFSGYHMSPNRLRFQAFTALAYGAEVINWACWMKGWWTHNVVNPDGTVNEYEYFILKSVNRELHALGPDYMRYRNVATHRVGFADRPKSVDIGPFRDINLFRGVPMVVGEMVARQGAGAAFLAVASGDPRDAGTEATTLEFRANGACRALRPRTGKVEKAVPDADGITRLEIEPAEALLVMDDFLAKGVVVSDTNAFTCGSAPTVIVSADGKTFYTPYLASRTGYGECHDIAALAAFPVSDPKAAKSHVVCEVGETFCGTAVSSVLSFVSFPWKGNVRVTLDVNYGICGWRDWDPKTEKTVGEGRYKCRFAPDAKAEFITPEALTRYLNGKGFTGHDVYRERGDRLLCGSKPCWDGKAFYGFATSSCSQPVLYRCADGETFDFLGVVPEICEYECQVAKLDGVLYAYMRGSTNDNFFVSRDGGRTFAPSGRLPDGKQRPQLQTWRGKVLLTYSAPDEAPCAVRNGRNNLHMLWGEGGDLSKYVELLHAVDPLGIVYYDIVDLNGDLHILWSNAGRFPNHVKWGAVQGKDQVLYAPLEIGTAGS